MISFELAKKLKERGLIWNPGLHDFFAVPDRGFDDRVFVISDIQSNIENILGSPVVAFQGASEWALDYLITSEAVWMPTEEQIRSLVEDQLLRYPRSALLFTWAMNIYKCEITFDRETITFEEEHASDAYGQALLYLLENERPPVEG